MIRAYLSDAARWCGAELYGSDREFAGVAYDSRQVTPGSLFVALKGVRHDGHDFLGEAEVRGAHGALVSRRVAGSLPQLVVRDTVPALAGLAATWRSRLDLQVIGVLGSNGKTTVKEMIAAILRERYGNAVTATRGNQNNELGVALNLLRLDSNCRAAVIEMGANGHGEIAKLGRMARPTLAIITNSGLDHIAGFGGREGSARANGEIFSSMDRAGTAILNGDDDYADLWRRMAGARNYLSFGFSPDAEVKGEWFSANGQSELLISFSEENFRCRLPLIGRHNAANALAASAACLTLELKPEMIRAGLAGIEPVESRLKPQRGIDGALIIDDTYNANPSSLEAALASLDQLPGKQFLVLGDMAELGKESEGWHRWAGQLARSKGIERLFCLGEWTRFASDAFGEGGSHFPDLESLLTALLPQLGIEVNVLIKGSRCMNLEKLVERLSTNFQPSSPVIVPNRP